MLSGVEASNAPPFDSAQGDNPKRLRFVMLSGV